MMLPWRILQQQQRAHWRWGDQTLDTSFIHRYHLATMGKLRCNTCC